MSLVWVVNQTACWPKSFKVVPTVKYRETNDTSNYFLTRIEAQLAADRLNEKERIEAQLAADRLNEKGNVLKCDEEVFCLWDRHGNKWEQLPNKWYKCDNGGVEYPFEEVNEFWGPLSFVKLD